MSPGNTCSKMHERNFYVDNLAKTSNCIVDLSKVYSEADVCMKNGNFELESWNSNCPELKELMVQGGNFEHDSVLEKRCPASIFPSENKYFMFHLKHVLLNVWNPGTQITAKTWVDGS